MSSTERIISAATPIYALIERAARVGQAIAVPEGEEPRVEPEPSDAEMAAAARGAVTIVLSGIFALVSIADNLAKISASLEREIISGEPGPEPE